MKVKSFIGACFFILFSFAVVLAQQTVITGQLVGSDGKAMPKAHVGFKSSNPQNPAVSLEVGKDGNYKVEAKTKGVLILEFTGSNHQRKFVPLFIEKDGEIKLNIKLARNDYKENFDDLKLVEDANNFNPATAKTFQKQADGTYVVEFETKKDRVKYEIFGLDKNNHTINGTQAEDYEYDGDGDYFSVVTAKDGKAKIVFDPTKLIKSSAKAEYSFLGDNPKLRAFAEVYDGIQDREIQISTMIAKAMEAGENPQNVLQKYSEKDKAEAVKARISTEKDPFVRQLLILDYFTYFDQGKKDENIALLAMNEIPASSDLWALQPFLISAITGLSKDKEKSDAYFDKFLAENSNNDLKAGALLNATASANFTQQEEKVKKYLAILEKDYPNTRAARQAKLQFGNNSVKVGVPVPNFKVVALENSEKNYSNESMKGKYYLIDFWATWCKPCVGEMPELHKAYEKFKGNNFEILSLSFDEKQEDINVFREKKWKMPWLHTFVTDGFTSELAKRFGVLGIPKPILVDPTGKIVATEGQLRGEELEKTLTRVLGQSN